MTGEDERRGKTYVLSSRHGALEMGFPSLEKLDQLDLPKPLRVQPHDERIELASQKEKDRRAISFQPIQVHTHDREEEMKARANLTLSGSS
jgi:hypothetical protein